MATRVHTYSLPSGGSYLSVIAKRAYRIQQARRATPIADEAPIFTDPEYADSINEGARPRLVHDSDLFCGPKPLTDVLLRGSARSRGSPVTMLDTALQVEQARKAVRVFGDRRIEEGPHGTLRFSAPKPFIEMPLLWDYAYGGVDFAADKLLPPEVVKIPGAEVLIADEMLGGVLGYPRNVSGRGFFINVDRSRVLGALAPNLEDPTDPVTATRIFARDDRDWLDRPVASCYGPIDWFTFPRAAFLIPPDFSPPSRPIHELSVGAILHGDLKEELDLLSGPPKNPRVYNAAPAGLAVCRLTGGERVKLWNLHRREALFEFDLPGDTPKLVLQPPGVAARTLAPLLQTVLIEPDEDRVTLTWAGVMEVAVPYPPEMTATMTHSAVWDR
jgi:hypothetical protein